MPGFYEYSLFDANMHVYNDTTWFLPAVLLCDSLSKCSGDGRGDATSEWLEMTYIQERLGRCASRACSDVTGMIPPGGTILRVGLIV
jgi:hypothetical protein